MDSAVIETARYHDTLDREEAKQYAIDRYVSALLPAAKQRFKAWPCEDIEHFISNMQHVDTPQSEAHRIALQGIYKPGAGLAELQALAKALGELAESECSKELRDEAERVAA